MTMSGNVIMFAPPGQVPMQSERLAAHQIVGLEGGVFPQITFAGNRFHITGADGVERDHDQFSLNVVILDIAPDYNKAWWASLDSKGPPDCFADDGRVPNGPEATRPTINIGAATIHVRSCAECPKQLEGSKGDGSTFKACGTKKRMAVLLPDEITKDSLGTVYLMNLGAWSLADKMPDNTSGPRGLRQYQQFLKSQTAVGPNGVSLGAVITRVEFDTNVSVPVLRFSVAARSDGYALWLPVEDQDRVAELIGSDAVRNVIHPTMTNRNSGTRTATDVTPRLAQATPQAAAAPAQAITQVAAPAPAPARAKPPAAPVVKALPAPPATPGLTDGEMLAKLLDLYEAEYPEGYTDMAAWATHADTLVVDALAWFTENTPELVTKASPPPAVVVPPAPVKLVAPPAAPKKPVARAAKTPAAVTTLPNSDPAASELADILNQLGSDLG